MAEKMIKEKVFSKVDDKNIKNDVMNSPIWKNCKHYEDVTSKEERGGFLYTVMFDGVTPVTCTKMQKL